MGIYDISHDNQILQALPNNKRLPKYFYWLSVLLTPIKWSYRTVYYIFKKGEIIPKYTAGTYTRDSVVRYSYKVYISLKNGNADLPTTTNWLELQSNHLGIDARVLFMANKLKLEYALNVYFDGGWCLCSVTNAGYIWISTNATETGFFRVGYLGESSSSVGDFQSSEPIGEEGLVLGIQYAFTVNVQVDLWNDLASNDTLRENIIRNFIDKYNVAGLSYNFVTYSGFPC